MKFILFSIFLHCLIFISGYTFNTNNSFQIDNIGTDLTTLNVSMDFNLNQQSIKQEVIEEKIIENTTVEKLETKFKDEIGTKEVIQKKEKQKTTKKIKKENQKKALEKPNPTPKKKISPSNESSIENRNEDFIQLSKGIYAAKNQGVEGLNYTFLSQPEPDYPIAAKRIGYSKEVIIKVRFLVGLDGEIEEIKFYGNDNKLGFHDEVEKALKNWKLTPITVNNKKVKLYFYKVFKFNQI